MKPAIRQLVLRDPPAPRRYPMSGADIEILIGETQARIRAEYEVWPPMEQLPGGSLRQMSKQEGLEWLHAKARKVVLTALERRVSDV